LTYGAPPAVAAPPLTAPPTYGSPGAAFGAPAAPYAPPAYSPPPAYGAPPGAALSGSIQPPPAGWDPYATPGCAPSALLPQDPYFQSGPTMSMATVQKFVQHVDLDYHWFVGNGNQELGINDADLSATFAFPLFFNSQTPLLVKPGAAFHLWEGPVSVLPVLPTDPPPADLPSATYDSYLDFCWNPQISPWFGADLGVRVGVYSDFNIHQIDECFWIKDSWPVSAHGVGGRFAGSTERTSTPSGATCLGARPGRPSTRGRPSGTCS
jgi:hypothetical protein